MSSAIGGGEAATALAGAVIFAVKAFVAGFPVDDPFLLFESAVEVVRANGRAAFPGCNAEIRYGSPAVGRPSSSSSSSSSSATVPPSSPRAPPPVARSVTPVAPLARADAVSVPARLPSVATGATRSVVGGAAPAGPPRGAASTGRPPRLLRRPTRGAWADRCPPLLLGPASCAVVPPPLPVVGRPRPPRRRCPPRPPPGPPRARHGQGLLPRGPWWSAVAGAAAAARRLTRRRLPSWPRPPRPLLRACPGVGRPPPLRADRTPRLPSLLRARPLRSRR